MLVAPQQMADFMRRSVAQYLRRGRHTAFGEDLDPIEENVSVGSPLVRWRHDLAGGVLSGS